MRIILTGNPNVGKSVVFSRLTDLDAVSSNYPGTTVEILKGKTKIAGKVFEIADIPGAYSLSSDNEAERIASKILKEKDYDVIFHVLDATILERNLFFSISVLSMNKPVIFLLNKTDIARARGISIDINGLSRELGVKIIPVVATTKEGFDNIDKVFAEIKDINQLLPERQFDLNKNIWGKIAEIISKTQKIEHKHPGLLEKLELMTANPHTAFPVAAGAVIASFYAIRFTGENLINYVFDPLFQNYYMPFLEKILSWTSNSLILDFLLGKTRSPMESFGLLTTGLYIPVVAVFPYIIAFYLILSLLEDIGYLPRLAVILDRFSHKLGLHGYATIPLIMGLGCKVPGLFSLRILENKKEKIIAASLLFLMSPCMPQTAMIFSILSPYPIKFTFLVFIYLFIIGFIAGRILNRFIKQETSEIFMEIPSYQIPNFKLLLFKVKIRIKEFIYDAVPMIFLGVAAINILDIAGMLDKISSFFAPFFSSVLNLPGEMGSVIVLGFLKKDVSIAMLAPFNLNPLQIVTASVFLVSYMPCAASLLTMRKELGLKITLYTAAFNFALSLFFSFLLASLLRIFS